MPLLSFLREPFSVYLKIAKTLQNKTVKMRYYSENENMQYIKSFITDLQLRL